MNEHPTKHAVVLNTMWSVAYGASMSDDETERLAAAVVYQCLSKMWDNYHKRSQVLAIVDFLQGGLDFWLGALSLPVEPTKEVILELTCKKLKGDKHGHAA